MDKSTNSEREQREEPYKVAIYLRVSDDSQVEKYGLDAQEERIRDYLKSKGRIESGPYEGQYLYQEVKTYREEGVSGTLPYDQRPEFLTLAEDLDNPTIKGGKPFDVVCVFKIDRLARDLRVLLEIVDYFEDNQVQFISASEYIDTTTSFGRAMLNILGTVAQLERDNIIERTQGGTFQAKKKGKAITPPYGYIKDKDGLWIPLNISKSGQLSEEAAVAKEIFDCFNFENLSPTQIASRLQERKILAPHDSFIHYGKRKPSKNKTSSPHYWTGAEIKNILADEAYLGRVYFGKTVNKVRVPKSDWVLANYQAIPLISQEVFNQVQIKLEGAKQRIPRSSKNKDHHLYLLSGLIRCGSCSGGNGKELSFWQGTPKKITGGQVQYYYQCCKKNTTKTEKTCDVLPIPADQFEEYIKVFVRALVDDPQLLQHFQTKMPSYKIRLNRLKKEEKKLIDQLNYFPEEIKRVADLYQNGDIAREDYLLRTKAAKQKRLETQIAKKKITQQLNEQELSHGYSEAFNALKKQALVDIFNNRELTYDFIHAIINKITIYARPKTDLDVIAGKPKPNQLIPDNIDIELKLSQEMILELQKIKFGPRGRRFEVKNVEVMPD
ncbi:MAG: recombinase family protein [bacterium]|nr:recombinase family protein [bacterium]